MERDASLQSLFYIFFRVPGKGALRPGFLHRTPKKRDTLPSEPLPTITQIPGRWAQCRLPSWTPMKRDAHPQSLPYITFRVPSKGAPFPGSPNRAPIEGDAPFPDPPFNYLSEFPVNGLSMILNRAPVEKSASLQSLRKAR